MNETQIQSMQVALVNCGEIRSKLRQALSTIEAWSDLQRFPCADEVALRERMKQVYQVAADMKDFEL